MTARRLLVEAGGLVASVIIFAWMLLGCGDNLIPPDAAIDDSVTSGYDPAISRCCDWFYKPWVERPQACLDELANPGECHFLHCLGWLVTYHSRGCR